MSDSISTALLNQHTPSTPPIVQATTLAKFTEQRLQDYFLQLDGNKPSQLYEMVIQQVEQPLIKVVLQQTHNNQSEAAKILGISRGTLRKKMALFGMLWTWYHGLFFAFVLTLAWVFFILVFLLVFYPAATWRLFYSLQ